MYDRGVGQRWTAEERAFYFAVHNLLLREWDPIGVADVPEARNEYNAYDAQVFQLLRAGSSAKQSRYISGGCRGGADGP